MDLKTSILVKRQLPEFVREEYPLFISFLEAYYEFLENKQGINKNDLIVQSKKLREIFDVDASVDEFENQFFNTFAKFLPKDSQVDKAFLLKNVLPLYQSKGSEESFKFLFRLLFREEIQIEYPRDSILIASDGKWQIDNTLKISTDISSFYFGDGTTTEFPLLRCVCPITGALLLPEVTVFVNDAEQSSGFTVFKSYNKIIFDSPLDVNDKLEIFYRAVDGEIFVNRKLVGTKSGATALVEKIFSSIINNQIIRELYLDSKSITGIFQLGELVTTNAFVGDNLINVNLRTLSELQSINVIDGGSKYNVGDPVIVNAPQAEIVPRAIVSKVFKANIDNIEILERGAGFQVGAEVFLDGEGKPAVDISVNSVFLDSPDTANVFTVYSDVISDIDPANTSIDDLSYGMSGIVSGNANTTIAEAFSNLSFVNIGEIIGVQIDFAEIEYLLPPEIDVEPAKLEISNTGFTTTNTVVSIKSYGSLGKTNINDGGQDYAYGDELVFTNEPGYFGFGAEAIVTEVDGNGTILKVEFVPAKISGTVNVASNSTVTVDGNDTLFEDELFVGRQIYINGETKTVVEIISNTSLNVDSTFSESYTEVPIRLYGKYLTGGQGYLQEALPTVTVSSDFGTDANIEVVCIMGDGEELEAVFGNNKPGEIETITIIEPGKSLTTLPSVDLTGYGDGTAIADVTLVSSFETLDGRWINSDGRLSAADIRLQGLNYYIDYAYVISSSIEFSKYKKLLKDLLSPSGSLPYGRLERLDEIDSTSLQVESEITLEST